MKNMILKTVIAATMLVSVCMSGVAQQDESLDDTIRSLSHNITRLEALSAPPSMQETHRQNINDQRIDLIALLGQKKGEVESYIRSVSANLRLDQRDKLSQQVNDLVSQIALQKEALKRDIPGNQGNSDSASVANSLTADNGNGAGGGTVDGTMVDNAHQSMAVAGIGVTAKLPATASPSLNTSTNSVAIAPPPLRNSVPAASSPVPSPASASCIVVALAPASYSIREQQICSLVNDIANNKLGIDVPVAVPTAGMDLEGSETFIVGIISKAKTLGDIEDTRTDKQTGSGAQTKGTTSLVVKGGTPSVLSWAVENGGATATTSGTTINFRFNPLGVIDALGSTGYFASYEKSERDAFTKFMRKTSFGVSFDASRGNQSGVFTGNTQQISAFSARYEFVSDRDPRNKKYAIKWDNLVDDSQLDYTNAVGKLQTAIIEDAHCAVAVSPCPVGQIVSKRKFKDVTLQNWLDDTNTKLSAISPPAGTPKNAVITQIEAVLRGQFDALAIDKLADGTKKQIISFVESLNTYLTARKTLLDEIAKGKVMAFEYTNHREVNAPDTSNFNFIAEKGTVGRMDLTFNASLNMYNSRPTSANVKRIRDFVFAGQFDAPLSEISGVGLPVVSIAARYERVNGNAFALDGSVVQNTRGDVGSLQLKLLLPIAGTGIRLPFSVTFANRTQLIKERDVRANFGFTFDLDRLLSNNPFFAK